MSDETLRVVIGRRLRVLRAEHDWTQDKAARAFGVTQASVSNYESGKRETPLGVLLQMAKVYEVPLNKLVTVDDLP